jgi:hypothetical protein
MEDGENILYHSVTYKKEIDERLGDLNKGDLFRD